MADAPSPRQREVLELFVAAEKALKPAPAYREICAALEITSSNSAYEHVTRLVSKGWLERGPRGHSRSLTLTDHARRVYGLPTSRAA